MKILEKIKKFVKKEKSYMIILIIFIVSIIIFFIYLTQIQNRTRNYRYVEGRRVFTDLVALKKRFSIPNGTSQEQKRKYLEESMNKNLNIDEVFYLKYSYYLNSDESLALEKVNFYAQVSSDIRYTNDIRAKSLFRLVITLIALPQERDRLLEEIQKISPYSTYFSLFHLPPEKEMGLLQMSYDIQPDLNNTSLLMFYLVQKYERSSSPKEREDIKKKILSVKYPIKDNMKELLDKDVVDFQMFDMIFKLIYLDTLIKLQENHILDKKDEIEYVFSNLHKFTDNISKEEKNYHLLQSYVDYTYVTYFLYKNDKVNALKHLKLLEEHMLNSDAFSFMFNQGELLENDKSKFQELDRNFLK